MDIGMLRSDIAARYADNLLKASQKRYHLREEFATMTNEERIRKYKDIPSPTKKARAETLNALVESMQRVGISQDMIQRAVDDWTLREYGQVVLEDEDKRRDGPGKIDFSGL